MTEIVPTNGSPFDALRRVDDRGEHWWAREIHEPLEYTWRRFTDAIQRGRIALRVNGQDPDEHISGRTEPSVRGTGRSATQTNYRMTREGVYATLQGADPRKLKIAEAWSYFRVRTQQAESIEQVKLSSLEVILASAERLVEIEHQQRRLDAERATHARAIEGHSRVIANHTSRLDSIEHNSDFMTVLGYAKLNGVSMHDANGSGIGRTLAARYRNRFGENPPSTRDQRYGAVFMYPVTLLSEVFAERGLK